MVYQKTIFLRCVIQHQPIDPCFGKDQIVEQGYKIITQALKRDVFIVSTVCVFYPFAQFFFRHYQTFA